MALAQNWTTVAPQHQCVHTMLAEPRLDGWLEALCVCVETTVSFSVIMSSCCSVIQLSLIDVNRALLGAGTVVWICSTQLLCVSVSAATQH